MHPGSTAERALVHPGPSHSSARQALPSRAQTLEAWVDSIRFTGADGRFAVLLVKPSNTDQTWTVVGDLAHLRPGELVRFRGTPEAHPTYGSRFRVESYTPVLPTHRVGLMRFLGSGLVEGVGPALAQRLVSKFGEQTIEVITRQSQRLREIDGIGKKRAARIAEAVRTRQAEADALAFLYGLGLGPALSRRVLKKYGSRTAEVMREDPYLAAEEVPGIGFRTADQVGRAGGIAVDDPRRVAGAVLFALGKAVQDGHVFLPTPVLVRHVERLEVVAELVPEALEALAARKMVEIEGGRVYPPPLHQAEVEVARTLLSLAGRTDRAKPPTPIEASLTETQKRAVEQALVHRLMVLTGGPGTGKTTTTKALVASQLAAERRVSLCAPTGRAAKRLSTASGQEAMTIHRLLEWNPARGTFTRDRDHPLETDLVLVDEASMLDLLLAQSLLDALPRTGRLVLVGDADQLPPVSAGQVLRELIRSARAPTVRLEQVFRQAQKSAIVRAAHAIVAGQMPQPTERGSIGEGDLFVVRADDPAQVVKRLNEVLARISITYRLDPRRDVQILCPMKKGPLGTTLLNEALQSSLNPGSGQPGRLRPGDKVMQMKNDYEREVFNGDIGWVRRVEAGVTYVEFEDGGLRSYNADELGNLSLAYVSTVHKAQGSEYPAVVIVMHSCHHLLLERALLYTAVTRAKRLVVLIGQTEAIAKAVRTEKKDRNYAYLAERMRGVER